MSSNQGSSEIRFGLYYYNWYQGRKWEELPRVHTPIIGEYLSSSYELISWQLSKIATLGISYLVFEMVPINDWSFAVIKKSIDTVINELKSKFPHVGYTFLLDFQVVKDKGFAIKEIQEQIEFICNTGWIQGVIRFRNIPTLFCFAPFPEAAKELTARNPDINLYYPMAIPWWGEVGFLAEIKQLSPFFSHLEKSSKIVDYYEKLNYCPFWCPTDNVVGVNKITSVVPGYDESSLNRDIRFMPDLDREDGNCLVEQFSNALKTGAEDILIYGWNEYFEATTIEPTLEYGDFYVELTRRLIQQAKEGEPIHFPEDLGKPQPATPIYLTPELERAAQRHPDKVPRWDQDDYVAAIDVLVPAVRESGHVFFREVRVANMGLKTWRIKTKGDQIRLGVRLYDSSKAVVREGRAELSDSDIAEGQSVRADLSVEIDGLVPGTYLAEIDLVWEEKFWFKSAINKLIALF